MLDPNPEKVTISPGREFTKIGAVPVPVQLNVLTPPLETMLNCVLGSYPVDMGLATQVTSSSTTFTFSYQTALLFILITRNLPWFRGEKGAEIRMVSPSDTDNDAENSPAVIAVPDSATALGFETLNESPFDATPDMKNCPLLLGLTAPLTVIRSPTERLEKFVFPEATV